MMGYSEQVTKLAVIFIWKQKILHSTIPETGSALKKKKKVN